LSDLVVENNMYRKSDVPQQVQDCFDPENYVEGCVLHVWIN